MRGRGAMPGAGRRVRRAPGARAPPAARRARRGARPGRDGWDACMGRGGRPSPARTFRGRRRRGRRGDPGRHRGAAAPAAGRGRRCAPAAAAVARARGVTLGLLVCNGPDRGLPAPESFLREAKSLATPARIPNVAGGRGGPSGSEGAETLAAGLPLPLRPRLAGEPRAGCTAALVQVALSPHAERPPPSAPSRIRAGAAGLGVPARMIRKAPPPAPPSRRSIITPARRPPGGNARDPGQFNPHNDEGRKGALNG